MQIRAASPLPARRVPAFWPALAGAPAVVAGNLLWLLGATLPGLLIAVLGLGACAAGLVRLRYHEAARFFGFRAHRDSVGSDPPRKNPDVWRASSETAHFRA